VDFLSLRSYKRWQCEYALKQALRAPEESNRICYLAVSMNCLPIDDYHSFSASPYLEVA